MEIIQANELDQEGGESRDKKERREDCTRT